MSKQTIAIETYRSYGGTITFAGTLRNQHKFEMFEDVVFLQGDRLVKGRIVGMELPPSDNPDWTYKVQIYDQFALKKGEDDRYTFTCDKMFRSVADAKESAMAHLDNNYDLNKRVIDKFFAEYENTLDNEKN